MGAPTAPDYDNIRLSGPDGLRYPLEVQKATFVVKKEINLGIVTGTVNLTPDQAGASFITANPSGALTLVLPGTQPGHQILVQNLSASYTITVEVSGNVSNVAVVPVSTMALVVETGLNSGVALAAVASVAAFQASITTVVYTSTPAAIAPNGTAVLKAGGVGAYTLVVPPAGATLSIVVADAHVYTIVTPALAIGGTSDTITFTGVVGNYIQLASSAGVWSVVSSVGATLTEA